MAAEAKMHADKMNAFNEPHFEKKLLALKDSQESIQALSTWCLGHRQHHKKIVSNWLKVLKKVKLDHRLALFYLANDVIQYSKRKNYEFVESWGTALQRATTMVRDEKVKNKILRIFKIWGERGIYDDTFVADLCGLMTSQAKKKPEPEAENLVDLLDFQPATLFVKIRSCHKLEDDTDLRLKRLNESHVSFSDADALRRHLKQKRQGDDVVAEVDEGVAKMQAYMKALEKEIKERKMLIEELDIADRFYEAQRGDAKLVVNAYKNFGSRVRNLKRHLDERLPTYSCPSPVPSPDYNAPSPEPDCDIELPEDNAAPDFTAFLPGGPPTAPDSAMDNCFASFLGNGALPFDFQRNLFSESTDQNNESEGKPIEVINNRSESDLNTNITNFLKSLAGGSLPKSPLADHMTPPPAPFPAYEEAPVEETADEYEYPLDTSPMEPPPMMPDLFTSDKFPPWEAEAEAWIEENGGWLDEKPLETPESPPMNEKESFAEPIVYDQSASLQVLGSSADVDQRRLPMEVDHRQIPPPVTGKDMDHRMHMSRSKDVDHRNLISLTGSPIQEPLLPPPGPPKLWQLDEDFRSPVQLPPVTDIDYRLPPPPPPMLKEVPTENRDNVESVDMDLSDDEATDISPVKLSVPSAKPADKPVPALPAVNKMTAISPLSGMNDDRSPTSSYKRQFHGSKKIETISVSSPRPLFNRVPFSPLRSGAPSLFLSSLPPRCNSLPNSPVAAVRPSFQQPPPRMMHHSMQQMQSPINDTPPSGATLPSMQTPPPNHSCPPPGRSGHPLGHNGPLSSLSGPPPTHSGPPPTHSGPPPNHSGPPPTHSGPPPTHSGPPPSHSGPPPSHNGPPLSVRGPTPSHNTPGGRNGPPGHSAPPGHSTPMAAPSAAPSRPSLGNNSPLSAPLRPQLGQNRPLLGHSHNPPTNKAQPPSLLSLPFKRAPFPENKNVELDLTDNFTDDIIIADDFEDTPDQEYCGNNAGMQVQNSRNGLENLQQTGNDMNNELGSEEDSHMIGRLNKHMPTMPPQRGRMVPPGGSHPVRMSLLHSPGLNESPARREIPHHLNEPPEWEGRNSERPYDYNDDSLMETDNFSEHNNISRGQFGGPRPLLARETFMPPRMGGHMLPLPRRGMSMGPRRHPQGRGGPRGPFRPPFRGHPPNSYGGW